MDKCQKLLSNPLGYLWLSPCLLQTNLSCPGHSSLDRVACTDIAVPSYHAPALPSLPKGPITPCNV